MKQISFAFAAALMLFASCGNSGKNNAEAANDSTAVSTDSAATGYKVADKANVDISKFQLIRTGTLFCSTARHSTDGVATEWTILPKVGKFKMVLSI